MLGKKIRGEWNWKKYPILYIISNKTKGNQI
jgi:hypothetical protein